MSGAGYPEIYADIAAHAAEVLKAHGEAAPRAAELGRAIAARIHESWGGELIYFPKGQSYLVSQRDIEFCKRLRGDNMAELCREYGFTMQRGYQILSAWRAREAERWQLPLIKN